jgi:hypothetical protein
MPYKHMGKGGPSGILSNGYCGLFHLVKSGQGMKLTTDPYLAPRSRIMELYLYSSIHLHGIVKVSKNKSKDIPITDHGDP